MDAATLKTKEIVYDFQFKQKLHILYFPFMWQGIFLLFLCWLLPLNLMEAGGVYIFLGFIIYRGLIVKKDHEVESIALFQWIISLKRWVEKFASGEENVKN